MSIKSTQRISRIRAIDILLHELAFASNDLIGDLLDKIADSGQAHTISIFDNFIVSQFNDEENK